MSEKKGYDELTHEQWGRRTELETIIDKGLPSSIDMGKALVELKEWRSPDGQRFYKATHKTWDQYLEKRFGISRSHASRLMGLARFVANLELLPRGNKLPKPAEEATVRPLAPFNDQTKMELWERLSAESGGEVPKRSDVEKAAEDLLATLDEEERAAVLAPRRAATTRKSDLPPDTKRLMRVLKYALKQRNAAAKIEDGERLRELIEATVAEAEAMLA